MAKKKKEYKEKFTVEQLMKKLAFLKTDRGTWESHWQEVTDFIHPRMNNITVDQAQGAKRTFQILDNTGIHCNELLAGALHGLLTNPDGIWFEMTTGDLKLDQKDSVRKWLQDTSRQIHNVLNNSNFQTEVHEMYLDLPSIGTGCQLIEEDEEFVVRFSTKFIKGYYLGENSRGYVDQVYREWKWNAAQVVEEFGLENVGEKVQKMYADGKEDKITVVHAVYPCTMLNPDEKSEKPFISQYILPEYKQELSVERFRQLPYVTPRWSKASGEVYGRSPGMRALPEIKVLNKMNETMLKGAQKVVDPPIQLPDDGFIMPLMTQPGGINYYRSGSTDRIEPVFNDTRIDFGFETMKDRRQRVRDAYYVDQLKLQLDQKYMTATEVMQRTEESMRLLGPMLGRMQSEYLRPMIERVYAIMVDRGMIAPAPAELKGRPLDVRYSSLIAKSQRVTETNNIMRAFQTIAPFIQMDPSVADNFHGDNAARVIAYNLGLPQEMIRDVKERDAIREQKAQMQQQQMQAQQDQMEAEQMKTGAEAMAKMGQASGE
jgi:hypothetical protein